MLHFHLFSLPLDRKKQVQIGELEQAEEVVGHPLYPHASPGSPDILVEQHQSADGGTAHKLQLGEVKHHLIKGEIQYLLKLHFQIVDIMVCDAADHLDDNGFFAGCIVD